MSDAQRLEQMTECMHSWRAQAQAYHAELRALRVDYAHANNERDNARMALSVRTAP